MLAYLKGIVTTVQSAPGRSEVAPVEVWMEVGGVGYCVWVAPSVAEKLKLAEEKTLYLSQSSAMYGGETTLYGFLSLQEKALFELLRELPGVGAKKALEYFEKIFSKSGDRFLEALARGDVKLLSTFFGFSPKTAAKMLAQLREKAAIFSGSGAAGRTAHVPSAAASAGAWVDGRLWEETHAALIRLGFGASDSEAALRRAVDEWRDQGREDKPTAESLIKKALQELVRAR